MNPFTIRGYRSDDLESMKRLTVDAFDGVTLEQNVEERLGILHGHDWRWRKMRHIDDDVATNALGIFVAESEGSVVGFITTREDWEAGKGRIPNLAVATKFRKRGLGRRLIEHALAHFRAVGLEYATIETMAQNAAGQHVYPACGFVEVARQVHYACRL